MSNEEYIQQNPHQFNDEIDKWLFREFNIIGGACSSQESFRYSVAREVAEKAMEYAKQQTIGEVRSILGRVAFEYDGLDVNGDYCEQPYIKLDHELKKNN